MYIFFHESQEETGDSYTFSFITFVNPSEKEMSQ